jgi:hypothetical protein
MLVGWGESFATQAHSCCSAGSGMVVTDTHSVVSFSFERFRGCHLLLERKHQDAKFFSKSAGEYQTVAYRALLTGRTEGPKSPSSEMLRTMLK